MVSKYTEPATLMLHAAIFCAQCQCYRGVLATYIRELRNIHDIRRSDNIFVLNSQFKYKSVLRKKVALTQEGLVHV